MLSWNHSLLLYHDVLLKLFYVGDSHSLFHTRPEPSLLKWGGVLVLSYFDTTIRTSCKKSKVFSELHVQASFFS
jgi:hypothetical protein